MIKGQEPSRPGFLDQDPRTSSQFLQEGFRSHLDSKKPSSISIGGGLGKTFAKMSQVYRQRVTHLQSAKGSGSKDEKEQRRKCKAEFPASDVAATALPRLTKLRRKGVCSYSVLSPLDSSSPSSETSGGFPASPRSPSSTSSTSGTESTSR